MPNPFDVLNPNSPMSAYQGNMGNMQSAYRAIMQSGNPMQAFQRIAAQNPRMQPILQALNGGANPQRLFNSLCQQRGIDPNQFLRSITGNNAY